MYEALLHIYIQTHTETSDYIIGDEELIQTVPPENFGKVLSHYGSRPAPYVFAYFSVLDEYLNVEDDFFTLWFPKFPQCFS